MQPIVVLFKLMGIRTKIAFLSDGYLCVDMPPSDEDYVCGYLKPHYPVPAIQYSIEVIVDQGVYFMKRDRFMLRSIEMLYCPFWTHGREKWPTSASLA